MDIELIRKKINHIIKTSTGKNVSTKYGYYIYKEYYKTNTNREIVINIGIVEGNAYFFTKKEDFRGKNGKYSSLARSLSINKSKKRYYDILGFTYDKEEAEDIYEALNTYLGVTKNEGSETVAHIIRGIDKSHVDDISKTDIIVKCLESDESIDYILKIYEVLFSKIFLKSLSTEDLIDSFNNFLNKKGINYEILLEKNLLIKKKINRNNTASRRKEKLESYLINSMHKDLDFSKKYYVYRHYYICPNTNKDITLYVGKGKGNRALVTRTRSDRWKEKAYEVIDKNIQIEVDIIRYFKNEKKALDLEIALISYYSLIGECQANISGKNLSINKINSIVSKIN